MTIKLDLETTFALMLQDTGIPEPTRQYRFCPGRRWAFDFCWPAERIAVEVEGGIWLQTNNGYSKGHANPKRFISDCEKYNQAACDGWRVLRVTAEHIDSGQAVQWLQRMLAAEQPPF